MPTSDGRLASSFRDPSGFLFTHDGRLYRQVNRVYADDFRLLNDSGLCKTLTEKGLLVPHREAPLALARTADAIAVLEPGPIPFISYPYEWCFTQLKDAALATLRIQSLALERGMVLKDASAYNVQFHQARPVFIDTLSFAAYREGEPWVAYRQFCQHFLAPLALMARCDVRLGALLREHIDGVPLDLAARLLPWRTRLQPALLMHIHAHAASQKKHADRGGSARAVNVSRRAMEGLVDNLRQAVQRLHWRAGATEWGDYYSDTNYSDAALEHKKTLVAAFLDGTDEGIVWDLGANNGLFSRLAVERGRLVIAADVDPVAVELNWQACRQGQQPLMLPLLADLSNPSPALGWAHAERMSLLQRGPADTVMALALVHHLAISNNVPLPVLASFFAAAGRHLIVEFVPKADSQVQRLLATRADIFPDYHLEGFRAAFGEHFAIVKEAPIADTERTLLLMRRKNA
jgi:ribosomal protein L11 methylase PrmA